MSKSRGTTRTPGRPGSGGPRHAMARTGEKAKNFKATWKKIVHLLRPYKLKIIIIFALAIISTLFLVLSPMLLGVATNNIVSEYVKQPNQGTAAKLEIGDQLLSDLPLFHGLGVILLILLGLYLLSALFNYLQNWLVNNITQNLAYTLRKDISIKINTLPFSYYDKQPIGDVMSRVTNDVDTISQTLAQSMSQLVSGFVMLFGILLMMLNISWILTVVSLVIIPLSMVVVVSITKKSQAQFKKQQKKLGEVNGHIEEMYSGHAVMRVFNGEEASVLQFRKINDQLYASAWKSQFLSALIYPLMSLVGSLSYVLVAVIGGWLAVQGRLSIGGIQAFLQYVHQFNQPITQTANTLNILQSTAAAAERVFEFLEAKSQSPTPSPVKNVKNLRGKIEFKNVNFGYNPKKLVIKNFNATIKPGERVAIVGPTGAGKTTIVNLLMRFYELNSGSILIDGVNIANMRRANVRKLFGMVLQDTWLFKGTIKENIAYGKPGATFKEVQGAAKEARVNHFVEAMPTGYDMKIDEDSENLSQGEKQLLTIARVLLADHPMLILDEATSSVDTRTELLIQDAMDRLMKGRTSFVIAHRLSTIREANLILVMDKGSIVEQGTHQELLDKNGFYANLYKSQFS